MRFNDDDILDEWAFQCQEIPRTLAVYRVLHPMKQAVHDFDTLPESKVPDAARDLLFDTHRTVNGIAALSTSL